MTEIPRRILGRTNTSVPFIWRPLGPGAVGDPSWFAVEIGPDALARRGDDILIDQLRSLGRTSCDLVIMQGIVSSDIKVGWPLHRLQQLRDRGLCRWFGVEVDAPLEAEWIAANAPVHVIVAPFNQLDMSIRYRTFDAAHHAGVAIVSRAEAIDDLHLQIATPQIAATITALTETPETMPEAEAEAQWQSYRAQHPEPEKLRSGHPPDYGV